MGERVTAGSVARELQSGERVLWEEAPDGRRWLQPQDALLIPFSLMWGGFAIFWEASALYSPSPGDSIIAPLWGIPFVPLGLYLIVGRLVVRRWLLGHTAYALTDRRAISITLGFRGGSPVKSVGLAPIRRLTSRSVATDAARSGSGHSRSGRVRS